METEDKTYQATSLEVKAKRILRTIQAENNLASLSAAIYKLYEEARGTKALEALK